MPVAVIVGAPASVIVALVADVGVIATLSRPVVPLTVRTSWALESPPLTSMPVRPVGVLAALLRLIASVPSRLLMVSVVLFVKLIGSELLTATWPHAGFGVLVVSLPSV